jgi:hypothetical protein
LGLFPARGGNAHPSKGFAEKEALRVIKSNDFIAYEDLNIQGMVKNSKL